MLDYSLMPNSIKYVKDRVVDSLVCNRCGTHVLLSDVKGYSYQCLSCDEDLLAIEVSQGNLINDDILEELCLLAYDLLLFDF